MNASAPCWRTICLRQRRFLTTSYSTLGTRAKTAARSKVSRDKKSQKYGPPQHSNKQENIRRASQIAKSDIPVSKALALGRVLSHYRRDYLRDEIFTKLNLDQAALKRFYNNFERDVQQSLERQDNADPLFAKLGAICSGTDKGMASELRYTFFDFVFSRQYDLENKNALARLDDLKNPIEWFPSTRRFNREIHLHVGPTNSGKTYHSLKRLQESDSGVYAGPLRLLAHEVYTRLNAAGKRCNLVTGDERKAADSNPIAPMSSCTVEMTPLNRIFDVAVIDEIQMIGDEERGWAWTQAVLGVMAREVHLCGEERAVPLVQQLAALCDEKVHVHRYERLNPLVMMKDSLGGQLKELRKGDCIVAFTILGIHALRQEIERTLNVKCAVIYGSLPPETRAQQAKLFNDPDSGYDILVASNAIGMGLNLNIKRMIFQSSKKPTGASPGEFQALDVATVKQIAGRAGRFSTASADVQKSTTQIKATEILVEPDDTPTAPTEPKKQPGLVTTLEKFDYRYISKAMISEPTPLLRAGIVAPAAIVERFSRYFPDKTPAGWLLLRLQQLFKTTSCFFHCDLTNQVGIADVLEQVEGLSLQSKLIFVAAPLTARKPGDLKVAVALARLVASGKSAQITDIDELDLELLKPVPNPDRPYLQALELLHRGVIAWIWLSYRFADIFENMPLAFHVRRLLEERIEDTLLKLSFDYEKIRKKQTLQAIVDQFKGQKSRTLRSDDFNSLPVESTSAAVL